MSFFNVVGFLTVGSSIACSVCSSEKYLPKDMKFIINDLKNKEREG